jgi:hypothetical protein
VVGTAHWRHKDPARFRPMARISYVGFSVTPPAKMMFGEGGNDIVISLECGGNQKLNTWPFLAELRSILSHTSDKTASSGHPENYLSSPGALPVASQHMPELAVVASSWASTASSLC